MKKSFKLEYYNINNIDLLQLFGNKFIKKVYFSGLN